MVTGTSPTRSFRSFLVFEQPRISHLRYDQLGLTMNDLDEVIDLSRSAVALYPLCHPDRCKPLNNLVCHLSIRYKQLGEISNLDETIDLSRSSLALHPPGRPDRSITLSNLAKYLLIRFTQLDGVDVREEVFDLNSQLGHFPHMTSSSDLSAATEWIKAAEDLHHPTLLPAYETALRFLVQHVVTLPSLPENLSVLKALTSSLAVDAFSACLRQH